MDDHKKLAVEKYLEQVKVLTALATTLLLTPNVLLSISKETAIRNQLDQALSSWRTVLVSTNIAFILVIFATYFIYSAVVGSVDADDPDVYRPATRVFSLAQFAFLVLGCVGLLTLFGHAT